MLVKVSSSMTRDLEMGESIKPRAALGVSGT